VHGRLRPANSRAAKKRRAATRVWILDPVCVQTRTRACVETAAPGNAKNFVWVVWKGVPPASFLPNLGRLRSQVYSEEGADNVIESAGCSNNPPQSPTTRHGGIKYDTSVRYRPRAGHARIKIS
jgi:hypothetical protein